MVELIFFAAGLFTADGNLLQLKGSVNRTLHTSHFLVCARMFNNVARDIRSRWIERHPIHVSFVCVCNFSSTLHCALFTVSPIFCFIFLIFIFFFYLDWFGEKYLVRFREWGVWLFDQQSSSHRLWATLLRRLPQLRPLKFSSRSLPATWGFRICMTLISLTTPSAERSLHHRSLRSEKNQRAVDKLITLEESLLPGQS